MTCNDVTMTGAQTVSLHHHADLKLVALEPAKVLRRIKLLAKTPVSIETGGCMQQSTDHRAK